MSVTLYADASFDPHYNVGGWGCHLQSKRGTTLRGGVFRQPVPTSSIAEMQAVVNAVYLALSTGVAVPGDEVVIRTDCIHVMRALEPDEERHSQNLLLVSDVRREGESIVNALTIREVLLKIARDNALTYRLEWVKGHQSGHSADAMAHNACDRLARKHMRRVRDRMIRRGATRCKALTKKMGSGKVKRQRTEGKIDPKE